MHRLGLVDRCAVLRFPLHVYEVRPCKDNRALIWSPMGCRSVGCGTTRRTMQSATRCTAAVHMMLWFAFTMPLAMWPKRTNTRAISKSGDRYRLKQKAAMR